MSRCNYNDDIEQQDLAMWRGRVASAIRGRRGQKLLRDLASAMDAMPDKRLIADELVTEHGEVCALGCVGKARGVVDIDTIDPAEHDILATRFDVAACLIQEIEWMNDEYVTDATPEFRWARVRKWVEENIRAESKAT